MGKIETITFKLNISLFTSFLFARIDSQSNNLQTMYPIATNKSYQK